MRDELIGRFVFVGTQPGTVTEVTPGTPATEKNPATSEMLKVKLHNVPNKMRSENIIVEVERASSEWRLKYPGEKRA
jgi:hypothetical protein